MRILTSRLLAVVDPEPSKGQSSRMSARSQKSPNSNTASARSLGRAASMTGLNVQPSPRPGTSTTGPSPSKPSTTNNASGNNNSNNNGPPAPLLSASNSTSTLGGGQSNNAGLAREGSGKVNPPTTTMGPTSSASDSYLDCFELLHTPNGFASFEQWYKKLLPSKVAEDYTAEGPRQELGFLWPQLFCPPTALPEHAFSECSEGEALDFFDLLDGDLQGMLSFEQVYLGICLVAALGCKQLTKFLYMHSSQFFQLLAKGCRCCAKEDTITWARLLTLLRLLGVSGAVLSGIVSRQKLTSPRAEVKYHQFCAILLPIAMEMDRGGNPPESTVIHEKEKIVAVRSKTCVVL